MISMNTTTQAPDLSQAASPGLLRRFVAMFYDAFLLAAVLLVASFVAVAINGGEPIPPGNLLLTAYFVVVAFLFFAWFWIHGGQTLGMRAWRFKVLKDDGQPLTWTDTLKRFLLSIVSLLPFGLGFLWSLLDSDNRAWHDKLSHTRLVMLEKK